MTTAVAPTTGVERYLSTWSSVLALSRFEGRMMVRHPLTLIGALAAAGLAIFELREEAPVLNRASVTLAWTMLPLAFAVALVAGWAAIRAAGRADAQPPAVMPLGMDRRVAGIVVGLAFPAALALFLQLSVLAWLLSQDPVTSVVWVELLTGPAYVVFAGAWSAALARWLPHPATPLFGVVALAGLMIVFPYRQEDWGNSIGIEWLAPLAWPQDIIPYEVAFRPAGLHLGYLIGLVMVVSGVAIIGRWLLGSVVLLGGLVVAAVLGPAHLGPIAESQQLEAMGRLVGDQAALTCEIHNDVQYCALPGYEGWIDDWAETSGPVFAAAPSADVQVRQYPVHTTGILGPDEYNNWQWVALSYRDLLERPKVVPVGSVWADYVSGNLARDAAATVMGCRLACQGDSQQIVYLWLAAHHPEIRSIVEGNLGGDDAPLADCIVGELWARPDERALIHANWATLTNPATTYQEAASLLDIEIGCQ